MNAGDGAQHLLGGEVERVTTDAGIVSQLWISRLRADHQAFIEPKDQNSGVKLGKGTGRAGVKHRTVYGHLAPGGGGGGEGDCLLRKIEN